MVRGKGPQGQNRKPPLPAIPCRRILVWSGSCTKTANGSSGCRTTCGGFRTAVRQSRSIQPTMPGDDHRCQWASEGAYSTGSTVAPILASDSNGTSSEAVIHRYVPKHRSSRANPMHNLQTRLFLNPIFLSGFFFLALYGCTQHRKGGGE